MSAREALFSCKKENGMKRHMYVYGGMALIAARRAFRRGLRSLGEWMKRAGRALVAVGEDSTPRWSIELFHRCYLADAEFHIGMETYRGPVYAAWSDGKSVFFKMNWLATRTDPHGDWTFSQERGGHGEGKLALRGCGSPHALPNGDVWFMFEGGHGILFIGEPQERLAFDGPRWTLRRYTYF